MLGSLGPVFCRSVQCCWNQKRTGKWGNFLMSHDKFIRLDHFFTEL